VSVTFGDIPEAVIDYIRDVFGDANKEVSTTLTRHPALHEESLDHQLIAKLTAVPPTFFAKPNMAVAIESHWLGGRHMYMNWEIADIAVCVILRERGRLALRKVALLQTKRLYSKEIPVAELERVDFLIGIGRIIDTTDPQFPLTQQRAFGFDSQSVYGALQVGSDQIERIDDYVHRREIPVYYGLYNPVLLPYADFYPITAGDPSTRTNDVGCRIIPSPDLHDIIGAMPIGQSPSFGDLTLTSSLDDDPASVHGWRLERFITDEVLRCRQGRLFEKADDPRLSQLLYARSAPISAAIAITIDFGTGGP
jgi:hypothetical protein